MWQNPHYQRTSYKECVVEFPNELIARLLEKGHYKWPLWWPWQSFITLYIHSYDITYIFKAYSTNSKITSWLNTVNPQKRPADLFLRIKIRVLLELNYFCQLFFQFPADLIRIWVLFEGSSLSRICGIYHNNLLSHAIM